MRSLFFIMLAVLFLGSSAYLGHLYFYDSKAGAADGEIMAEKAPAMWALQLVKDVERGEILQKGLVRWHPVPDGREGPHLLNRQETDLAVWQSAAFARTLKKGAFLQETDLVPPTAAVYLKTLLPDGMRAQAVAVENLADFKSLRPGDHVDLILTYAKPSHALQAGEAVVKTILENVRVLALEQAAGKRPAQSLTLALLPKDVELVSMAEVVGKLRISLHGGTAVTKTATPADKAALSASDFFPDLKPESISIVQDNARDIRIMRGGETSVVTLKPVAIK
jgi:Flp pilus assembly protein CpaB